MQMQKSCNPQKQVNSQPQSKHNVGKINKKKQTVNFKNVLRVCVL